jgi:hypothetical protein
LASSSLLALWFLVCGCGFRAEKLQADPLPDFDFMADRAEKMPNPSEVATIVSQRAHNPE